MYIFCKFRCGIIRLLIGIGRLFNKGKSEKVCDFYNYRELSGEFYNLFNSDCKIRNIKFFL